MRSRSVVVWLFPVLGIALFVQAYLKGTSYGYVLQNIGFDLCFLSIQLLLVSVYFSIKSRKWVWITREMLGWGDILFLVSIACYLSPVNYILFYVASLVLILVAYIAIRKYTHEQGHIPLAGLQALLMAVILIANWQIASFDLTSDAWLIKTGI
ncbi:hypothetical protein HQ865_15275 [Mucilaginibacter mali]|uniref:Prepilin type IV endopeptidase peptidase domain-containing protein n=1 Tax=Mucilaginibacter mali TaxID=2740462 RepID=A0A7D4TY61_9SPHI|nr:hypothetical protein [Mucilaginibacter mali]QKJ31057.1 hypothetical protein HQ865_15275 [Mucilaginibacter mali]